MNASGFDDLTEGMYEGDPRRSYEEAQARKASALLDRAECGPGSRLLDIGCGYGRILKTAAARGAVATGITVCPKQARRGRRTGLDVKLQNYKTLGPDWNGRFDAVVANGSLEHFAQPADAVVGRDSEIYRHFFATAHRLIGSGAGNGRLVTTAIHVPHRPDPNEWLRRPSEFPRGSAQFHFARLRARVWRMVSDAGPTPSLRAGVFLPGRRGGRHRRLPAHLRGMAPRCAPAVAFGCRALSLAPGAGRSGPAPHSRGPVLPVRALERIVELAVSRRAGTHKAAPPDLGSTVGHFSDFSSKSGGSSKRSSPLNGGPIIS